MALRDTRPPPHFFKAICFSPPMPRIAPPIATIALPCGLCLLLLRAEQCSRCLTGSELSSGRCCSDLEGEDGRRWMVDHKQPEHRQRRIFVQENEDPRAVADRCRCNHR